MKTSIVLLSLALMACGNSEPAAPSHEDRHAEAMQADVVVNQVEVSPGVVLGGVLKDGGVAAVGQAGFDRIIDLRSSQENGVLEEERAALAAGIPYTRITMPGDPVAMKAFEQQLVAALDAGEGKKTLLHCASGNRAARAWALYLHAKGTPTDDAILAGKKAGMRGGEDVLREVMSAE
ncbi:MAG: hypothetical protein ACWA5T_12180 [Parvularcula sp.]